MFETTNQQHIQTWGAKTIKIEVILNSDTKFHGNDNPALALELSLAAMAVCSSSSFSAERVACPTRTSNAMATATVSRMLPMASWKRTFSGTLGTSTDFLEDDIPVYIYIYPNLDTQMMVYGVGGEIFCWGLKIRYLTVLYRETYRDWASFDQWTWEFNEQIWCSFVHRVPVVSIFGGD